MTYTSIPQRISSPPPVAKTTCRQPRPGKARWEGEEEEEAVALKVSSSEMEGGGLWESFSAGAVPRLLPPTKS